MQTLQTRLKDTVYLTGLLAVLLSAGIFLLPQYLPTFDLFSFFIINFLITASYFIVLLVTGRLKRGRDGLAPMFLLLILSLISAYSLNREMNVFESSVTWLSVLLVLVCINYIAFAFFETMPRFIKYGMCFVLGISCCLFAYLSIYLVPLYLMSAVGFFLLGISLHTFVPLLLTVYSLRLLKRTAWRDKNLRVSFFSGSTSVAILLIAFVITWSHTHYQINKTYQYAMATNDNLPAWVSVAQTIPENFLTEKIFKTSLVYSVPEFLHNDFLWRMPNRNFDEQKKHDPLVMIASFFTGPITLEENDRIKVLESQYDSRHQAQERLWSDENLQTTYVNTNVRIWPQYAISYTEKTFTVSNLKNAERWASQEEAIYTFHLPEGGVVSSLSLWINGKEEKGLLTTKEKAATAYRTIVGVESRDPSVVHWQEGNTVSVRVFPVMAGKSRVFQIGITAPLQKHSEKLIYNNIYFDGPAALSTPEDIAVNFDTKQKTLIQPASFNSTDEQHYTRSGNYDADWSIDFPYEGLSPKGFSYNGNTYSLSPYNAERSVAKITDVYLDINCSWTRNEFDKVYALVKHKNVYVFNYSLLRVDTNNKDRLFKQLSSLQFSLFPLYEIKNAAGALVISKSAGVSPDFNDLEGSAFLHKTKAYLGSSPRIKLFHLGSTLSPYLKTLLEYRVFNFEQGNSQLLQLLMAKSVFALNKEDSNHVVIYTAGLMIAASPGEASSPAPDHLMRLYAYNHIMQNAGKKLLDSIPEEDELVMQAKTAGIVTPLSSLVVLETQQDYDRFDIQQSKDSLGNASLKSKGSVPEPHEWLLILMALAVFAWIRFRPFLGTL